MSDIQREGRYAQALLERGRIAEALRVFRRVCAETHSLEVEYDDWLQGLARALVASGQRRAAAYVFLHLRRYEEALLYLDEEALADRARVLDREGSRLAAGDLYEQAGLAAQAAVAYHRVEAPPDEPDPYACAECGRTARRWQMRCDACGGSQAVTRDDIRRVHERERRAWGALAADARLAERPYELALVHFNLGMAALRLGDTQGHVHLVTAQRLLEEAADAFETGGLRERAFDCCQILLELGRRSGAFENLAEGYINCIRILRQDHLKFYVLQYYEDFLREALARKEYRAAATLYREAAEFCARGGLIYDRHYLRCAADAWLLAGGKVLEEDGPPEMAESALLSAVDCFNAIGDYRRVGDAYGRLAELPLTERRRARYARIAARYDDAPPPPADAPAFPDYLRQPHAYPEIWLLDLVEWEHDGDAISVCAAVVGDASYPDVVRRRALNILLHLLLAEAGEEPRDLPAVAEALGDLQVYDALAPLERLYDQGEAAVRRGVMRALRLLFFKRTFGLLARGLRDQDGEVRRAAVEALGRLHFNHAFDPLVRIFRESDDDEVRRTALESIGRIPSLEAGEFLVDVLRHEPDPLRAVARNLLATFENRDLFPILRQHYELEPGPVREDLRQVLQRVGAI